MRRFLDVLRRLITPGLCTAALCLCEKQGLFVGYEPKGVLGTFGYRRGPHEQGSIGENSGIWWPQSH